jgi:hypothetical protein
VLIATEMPRDCAHEPEAAGPPLDVCLTKNWPSRLLGEPLIKEEAAFKQQGYSNQRIILVSMSCSHERPGIKKRAEPAH